MISLMLTFSYAPNSQAHQASTIEDNDELTKVFVKYQKLLIGAYCLAFLYVDGNQEVQEALRRQLEPKNLLKNFSYEYSTNLYATFFHELGHALAAKALAKTPISIHIGTNIDHETGIIINPLQPAGGDMLYYKHFDDRALVWVVLQQRIEDYYEKNGINQRDLTQEQKTAIRQEVMGSSEFIELVDAIKKKNNSKRAIIMLAGGTLSIITHIFIQSLLTYVKNKKSYAQSLQQALIPDSIICHQVLNMFLPFATKDTMSDGAAFWESMGASPESISRVSPISPFMHILAETALARKASSHDQNILHNALVGLFNDQLRGFLRLKT